MNALALARLRNRFVTALGTTDRRALQPYLVPGPGGWWVVWGVETVAWIARGELDGLPHAEAPPELVRAVAPR